jgi:hypothetical protein
VKNPFRARYKIEQLESGNLAVRVRYFWDIFGWMSLDVVSSMDEAVAVIERDKKPYKRVTVYEE